MNREWITERSLPDWNGLRRVRDANNVSEWTENESGVVMFFLWLTGNTFMSEEAHLIEMAWEESGVSRSGGSAWVRPRPWRASSAGRRRSLRSEVGPIRDSLKKLKNRPFYKLGFYRVSLIFAVFQIILHLVSTLFKFEFRNYKF